MSVLVPKRRDRCANREAGCQNYAREPSHYCGDKCLDTAAKGIERKILSGGMGSYFDETDRREDTSTNREPITGTRRPRELSRDGSGYA